MARMPGAIWRPVPNRTANGQSSVRGVVVHIMAGTLTGTDSWFRNPAAQASSHFGTGKNGDLYQWVDTADRAWAQASGNSSWLSVENEGKGGDTLTDAQLTRNAEVLAWAHAEHEVPLQLASNPSEKGLGYHAMGGTAWGGHTSCPGPKIVAQLGEIVKRAKAIAKDTAPAQPATPSKPVNKDAFPGAGKFGAGANNAYVTRLGQMLVARGGGRFYKEGPGPKWGDADKNACQAFQKAQGWTGSDADGIPGPSTWQLLVTGKGKNIPAAKPAVSKPAYEPFPGAGFFHAGRNSPLITAMGRRLVAEGCGRYSQGPGPNWTNVDKASYAAWQKKCGYSGASADGIPGKDSWDRLHVPKTP
ncbi:peptidoglycan-binding protein [Streptomyces sp. NPDC060243]|uniref:peptidoglycan-binding protein n=1 Tax=Streptomyces sp. NPDC060243 TaxID=3347081 RepID=UPI00365394DC